MWGAEENDGEDCVHCVFVRGVCACHGLEEHLLDEDPAEVVAHDEQWPGRGLIHIC